MFFEGAGAWRSLLLWEGAMAFAVARMMSLYVSLMVAASFLVHCGQARVLSEDVVVTQLPSPAKHQMTPLDFVDPQ